MEDDWRNSTMKSMNTLSAGIQGQLTGLHMDVSCQGQRAQGISCSVSTRCQQLTEAVLAACAEEAHALIGTDAPVEPHPNRQH